jgi:hypothetical protein
MPSASFGSAVAWGILAQELLDALQLETNIWINAFFAERVFPRIAG